MCGPTLLLRQELADHLAFILVMDTSKQLGAKRLYRFGSIEGKLVIHLAAAKVTALTLSLEDWFDLSGKIDSGTV